MADPSTYSNREPVPSTPRWVKVFAIVAIVLVVLFVVLHLTGTGLGGVIPVGRHG
jgi:hypothetical protein